MNKVWINLKDSFVRRLQFESFFDTSRDYDDSLSKRVRVENCYRWFLCSNSTINQNHENCDANKNSIRNASSFKREWWHSRHFLNLFRRHIAIMKNFVNSIRIIVDTRFFWLRNAIDNCLKWIDFFRVNCHVHWNIEFSLINLSDKHTDKDS